jgi:hypothetical protein
MPNFGKWHRRLVKAVMSGVGQQETECDRQAMSALRLHAEQFSEKADIAGAMPGLPGRADILQNDLEDGFGPSADALGMGANVRFELGC